MLAWQEQSQQLEAQHAASVAELQELKQKQKSLEARNMLLEKLMQMNKESEPLTPAATTADDVRAVLHPPAGLLVVYLEKHLNKAYNLQVRPGMFDHCQRVPEPFIKIVTGEAPLKLTVDKDREQIIQFSEINKLPPSVFVALHKVRDTTL